MSALYMRSAAAIFAGLVVATLCATGVEWMSAVLHPFPPGFDPSDMEACRAHVANYPRGVLLLASLGWGLGVFAAAWVATRLGTARHPAHGLITGVILLALAITNMAMLPYPAWFWVANLVLFPAGVFAGSRLGSTGPGAPA